MKKNDLFCKTKYENCGRKSDLSDEDNERVVDFVVQWRSKRFCTANYIIRELKLKCKRKTIHRVLNAAGFHWRPVPKKSKLTDKELKGRQIWVDERLHWTQDTWKKAFGLVLDGVTLTRAPKALTGAEKHAAQSIKAMWVKKGEALDNNLHTYNRYGVQLGIKVPLWGGFTGEGDFTYKFWSEKPKLTNEIWAKQIKTGVKAAACGPKIWHDNEKYLKQEQVYKQNGLKMVCFPPGCGDLNPIETVWSKLRETLAEKEMEDIDAKRTLTTQQFRQRVSFILNSFSVPKPGQKQSYLQKLIAGMPKRLADCKANGYGNCGK